MNAFPDDKTGSTFSESSEGEQHEMFSLVYEELKRIAQRAMRSERPGITLQPTALVNEVWLKLFRNQANVNFDSRAHFFVVVSNAMRQILVDAARARTATKRGKHFNRSSLPTDAFCWPDDSELLELHDALQALKNIDPVKAQLVNLRYFSGLTIHEAANVLEISPATANRYWSFAKAWLRRQMASK